MVSGAGKLEKGATREVTSKTFPRLWDRICGRKSAPRWCERNLWNFSRLPRDRHRQRVVAKGLNPQNRWRRRLAGAKRRVGPSNFVVSRSYTVADVVWRFPETPSTQSSEM